MGGHLALGICREAPTVGDRRESDRQHGPTNLGFTPAPEAHGPVAQDIVADQKKFLAGRAGTLVSGLGDGVSLLALKSGGANTPSTPLTHYAVKNLRP